MIDMTSVSTVASCVEAATVHRAWWARLAGLVLAGAESFDAAYATARARKQARQDDERKRDAAEANLAKLRAEAPDLAARVDEWRMSLEDAMAERDERARREAEARRATTALAVQTFDFLDSRGMTTEEQARMIAGRLDGARWPSQPDFSADRLARCAATLAALAEIVREGGRDGSG